MRTNSVNRTRNDQFRLFDFRPLTLELGFDVVDFETIVDDEIKRAGGRVGKEIQVDDIRRETHL